MRRYLFPIAITCAVSASPAFAGDKHITPEDADIAVTAVHALIEAQGGSIDKETVRTELDAMFKVADAGANGPNDLPEGLMQAARLAIAADNPDATLPDQAITPVNRSDESGTTANFQEYLKESAGDAWPHEPSGDWAVSGGEAAQGTSGVVDVASSTDGAITYADASAVGTLGTVDVKVGDEYVKQSPEAAAKVVDGSEVMEGRPEGDLAMDLNREVEGSYPVVLVAYEIVCTEYENKEDADRVKDFMSYVISEEAQQRAADDAGSAPISPETAEQIATSLEKISAKG